MGCWGLWFGVRVLATTPANDAPPHATALLSPPGIKDACSVFYRTLSSYLSRVADYHELRMATAQAAADLFGAGSPQVRGAARGEAACLPCVRARALHVRVLACAQVEPSNKTTDTGT